MFVYTHGLESLLSLDWENADVRVILVDSTSTAGDDEDAAFIDDIDTLGEVSGTGYSRKALENKTATLDATGDKVVFSADDVVYGGIDVGQIYGVLFYLHVNDDTDSVPLLFIDNSFLVTAAAPAAAGDTTVYVDPLVDRVLIGSVLAFPNAVLATLTATADAGDRELAVQALDGEIELATSAIAPAEGFPIPTSGDVLTIGIPDILLEISNR